MKKIYLLLLIVYVFIISCGGHFFNPRYYYNKGGTSSDNGNSGGNGEDIGGGEEGLSPDEDPFQKPELNDPGYGGFEINLDDMVIIASFDGQNRPSYRLEKRPSAWQLKDPSRKEYTYAGDPTSAGGTGISSVTYYMYKNFNPNYSSDSKYNQSERLNRFYFYRFTGKGGGVADLNNYLIAIDRYTKLVFAFAVPIEWKTIMPGFPKAPKEWGPVESGYEIDVDSGTKSFFSKDGITYFYEYDPVGIVKSDGNILVYEWCLNSIGNRSKYGPQFDGTVGDTSRKVADYNGPGRSPYMPLKVSDSEASEDDAKKFEDDIKTLSDTEYKYRDYSGYIATKPGDKGQISDLTQWAADYSGKSLVLYTYSLTDNGKTITITDENYETSAKNTKVYKLSKINSDTKATYTNVNDTNDTKSLVIIKNTEGTAIDALTIGGTAIDFNFVDYGPVFVDRVRNAHFKRDGERSIGGGIGGALSATFPLSIGGKLKDLEYIFNDDGTEFTMKYTYDDGGLFNTKWKTVEFRFKLARFDSDINNMWAAKYESLDISGTLGKYTRVVLRDSDKLVRSSMTLNSLGFWDNPSLDSGLEMIADRK